MDLTLTQLKSTRNFYIKHKDHPEYRKKIKEFNKLIKEKWESC